MHIFSYFNGSEIRILLKVVVSHVQSGRNHFCPCVNFERCRIGDLEERTSVEHPSKQCYVTNALDGRQEHAVWGKTWHMTILSHKVIQS